MSQVKLWEAPSISVQLFVWFMCECQQINRLPPIHTSQTKPFYRIQTMKHMKWRQHELQSWQIWLHFTLRILLQRLHSRTQESLKAGHTEFIQCPHSCLSVHSRRNSTPSFDVEQWNGQKREVVEPQVPRCSCWQSPFVKKKRLQPWGPASGVTAIPLIPQPGGFSPPSVDLSHTPYFLFPFISNLQLAGVLKTLLLSPRSPFFCSIISASRCPPLSAASLWSEL